MVTIESVSLFATHLVSPDVYQVVQQASVLMTVSRRSVMTCTEPYTIFYTCESHSFNYCGARRHNSTSSQEQSRSATFGALRANLYLVRKRKVVNILEIFGPMWINVGTEGVYKI